MPGPPQQEWQRLYSAATAFKKAAPWEWMEEDELFGVRDPETGDIGWVSVMGQAGGHHALALYLGAEGLHGFWAIHEGGERVDPMTLFEVPELQASFEDREMLTDRDRQVVKSLGLRPRGKMQWPMFRSYVPGHMPWYLTAAEARFLAVALEQALNVVHRLEENADLLEPEADEYLVRVQRGEEWEDEWVEPDPYQPPPIPRVAEARIEAVRTSLSRQRSTLEVALYMLNAGIQEKPDDRPVLPYNLLVVDGPSGMVVGSDLMTADPGLDAVWLRAQETLLKIFEKLGGFPSRVAVRDEWQGALFGHVAHHLGIELIVAHTLPSLDQARFALQDMMRRGR